MNISDTPADHLPASDYLNLIEGTPPSEKTRLIQVRSKSNNAPLGEIKWYGPWRQYCFFPMPNCIFNFKCIDAISSSCFLLTNEHAQIGKAKRSANSH